MVSLRQLFLNHVAQTSKQPPMVEIDHAQGVYFYDVEGRAYLDLISGISVSSLGHCHPAVIKAVQEQTARYMHTMVYGEFVLAPQVELARLLADQLPPPLDCVYFVNSGSEAAEGAMKLAKRLTGRQEIVAFRNAYHGNTQGALGLISDIEFTQAFRPLLPGIRHLDFNAVEQLEQITSRTACVFAETVQAGAGVRLPQGDFLKQLRKRCNEVGALLVLDEIQVGYGRTGTLFAFEQYDIVPDILLLAKGMGGGMPIGAFVASREHMDAFTHNPVLGHITTFGGHPVICAAGLATLRVLVESDLISKVKRKESLFRELLVHPLIREVRSAGFLMAVDLGGFDVVEPVVTSALKQGILTDWFLFNSDSIRIAPPLIITEEEIRWACARLLEVFDDL